MSCERVIVPLGPRRADAHSRYQMFESNMDEYLDEEVESVKLVFETVVKGWDHKEVSGHSFAVKNH